MRNTVTREQTTLQIRYTKGGATKLTVQRSGVVESKSKPAGALAWEYQIQTRAPGSPFNPWGRWLEGFSTTPQITLDPDDFIKGDEYRIRTRWNGAMLPGHAPNAGPWSAWRTLAI